MAILTGITAVRPTTNTQIKRVTYGATVAVGQVVYYDTTDEEYKLADANDTEETAQAVGIAITPGVDGGEGYIATGGSIILVGTTVAVGQVYVVSQTAGGIDTEGTLTTNDYVTTLGLGESSSQLAINIQISGIQHA